jgi:hypothetical protein
LAVDSTGWAVQVQTMATIVTDHGAVQAL